MLFTFGDPSFAIPTSLVAMLIFYFDYILNFHLEKKYNLF
jgi:hypothetical protein